MFGGWLPVTSWKNTIVFIQRSIQSRELYITCYTLTCTSVQLITIWENFSNTAINARKLFEHKYSPQTICRYTFTQQSELEKCKVNEFIQRLAWLWRTLSSKSAMLHSLRHSAPATRVYCKSSWFLTTLNKTAYFGTLLSDARNGVFFLKAVISC